MRLFNKDAKEKPVAKKPEIVKPILTMSLKQCLDELGKYKTTKDVQDDRPKLIGQRIINLLSSNNHGFYKWLFVGGEAYSALAQDKNLARPLFYKLAKGDLNFTGSKTVTVKSLSFRDPDAFKIEYSNDMQGRWVRGAKRQNSIHEALVQEGINAFVVPAVYECKAYPFFIVMQYLPASPLMTWAAKKEMRDILLFFLDLLAAVNFLHCHGNKDAGIIHRDLKPENIMVTEDDKPVITDWGLAKLKGEEGLSLVGRGRGTMRFSSLDQLSNAVDASYHNDAYSLGLIMASILNHKIPPVENEEDLLIESLRYQYLQEHRRPLDPSLQQIFDKATNNDIKKRYMRLDEFYCDIQNLMVSWGWLQNNETKDIYAKYYSKEEIESNSDESKANTVILAEKKEKQICFECCNQDICSKYQICLKRIKAQRASKLRG